MNKPTMDNVQHFIRGLTNHFEDHPFPEASAEAKRGGRGGEAVKLVVDALSVSDQGEVLLRLALSSPENCAEAIVSFLNKKVPVPKARLEVTPDILKEVCNTKQLYRSRKSKGTALQCIGLLLLWQTA